MDSSYSPGTGIKKASKSSNACNVSASKFIILEVIMRAKSDEPLGILGRQMANHRCEFPYPAVS